MKNLNNIGVTLLEVLLASVIFMISVAGLFVTLNAVRVPVLNKENQLAATVFGKQVLDALSSQVTGDANSNYANCSINNAGDAVYPSGSCGDFSLYPGNHEVAIAQLPVGITWPAALTALPCSPTPTLDYVVTCSDGTPAATCVVNYNANPNSNVARGVTLSVNWPNVQTGLCS